MTIPVETELKFTVDSADLPAIRALDMLAGLADEKTLLEATYFDTPDAMLHAAGFSLRLRRSGDRVTQTLKGPAPEGAGLFRRSEDERIVPDGVLDEAALAKGLPAALFARIRHRLVPRFTVSVTRSAWRIGMAAGTVSVSIDEGRIVAGAASEPVAEIEFELLDGDAEALFALARQTLAAAPIHLQPLAKSERGHRLAGGAPRADAPATPPADSVAGTGTTLRGLAAMLAHDIAIARGDVMASPDPEAIHRLRVSLRRLAALLDLAAPMLPGALPPSLATVSREAFRRLGAARDLDILQAIVPVNQMEAAEALASVARGRNAALLHARECLASRPFAAALLDLLAFAEGVPPDAGADREGAPAAAAAAALEAIWQEIRNSPSPGRLKAGARHRLRIRAKRLRDLTDLVGGLFADEKAGKRSRKLIAALRDMQDRLGALNDRRAAWRLGRLWLGKPLARSLGLQPASRSKKAALQEADASFRRLVKRRRYWRAAKPAPQ